ncbi:hypothetical protein GGE07_001156 [Sinorhizobium terangae]|uniref:Uncharacterized protein n=1 Tax=Sinorhizobium terangae TaxID=110322 RepID=A0A6N7LEW3_SINTE|nr:hypothetical protein [Sinorhizobium terangae]MBB4184530.1 hypothetical protein [Sinorhizobium terangae]MQX16403.1 hypothetical protein [Sinorhizobium terangae]
MTNEPRNKYFDTPLSEWIDRVPSELHADAVGLWQIIGSGNDGFELQGQQLEDFVRRCIVSLLKAGAVPVRPSASLAIFWEKQSYEGDIEEVASAILGEWQRAGTEPNEDGIWFSLFDQYKGRG